MSTKKTGVVTLDQPAQNRVAVTTSPSDLIRIAVEKNMDVEKLTQLMDLQDRWDAKNSKKAFLQAMSDFQAMVPAIVKRKVVNFTTQKGTTNYAYAPLSDIIEQIKEPLNQVGLSYRFVQELGDTIKITCILSHFDGHSECTALSSVADGTGNKNSIQGIGSTVTYLQRYTLIGILGLTTADSDMDGRISQDMITDGQAASIKARLEFTGSNVQKFCHLLGIPNVDAMPASKYAQADKVLTQKETKIANEVTHADS